MRVNHWIMLALWVAGSTVVTAANAKVSAAEAAHIGTDLTPTGATAAANADGTISKWIGESYFDNTIKNQTAQSLEALRQQYEQLRAKNPQDFDMLMKRFDALTIENNADVYQQIDRIDAKLPADAQDLAKKLRTQMGGGGAYERPKFVITHDNFAQYAERLSVGQKAMFKKYADYKMIVYPSLRTVFYPDAVNRATLKNAVNAEMQGTDEVDGAVLGFPFPIPKSGAEVIWNHKMAFRGPALRRYNNQVIVRPDGTYTISKLIEDIKFKYANLKENNAGTKLLFYYLSRVLSPPRVAGQELLVHENSGVAGTSRDAWLFNPGLGRVNRAPEVGYDDPAAGSDGEQFNDQIDVFNGALDRYDWKLVGKKEIYIPYNSYLLISPLVKYKDIIRAGHVNQNLLRYELHRVWVVDATLKAGFRHQFKRRTFYVDEDGWAMVAVDCYDNHDQLWKVQESELITIPFVPGISGVAELIYDLQSGRYFVTALQNEDKFIDFKIDFKDDYFSPGDLNRKSQTQ